MEMKQSQEPSGDVDPVPAAGGTAPVFPEMLPEDYWSVSMRAPKAASEDLSESRWKQVGHLIQVWWNRIEDDEVAGIEGKASRLASLLQRRYRYTEYHAESQSIRWMRQHRDEQKIAG